MKHLYLIGNGFDIFTGLHTKYSDFKQWLKYNNPSVYDSLSETYNIDGDWWNDFEHQLGHLDLKRFIDKFSPSEEEEIRKIRQRWKDKTIRRSVDIYPDTPCANRLRGLFDALQDCFERWIDDCQNDSISPQYTNIIKDDSYFITFNYTDTLERLYNIQENRVLHIHGRSSKHEHLVFGHNNNDQFIADNSAYYDFERTVQELLHYEKNPYVFIYRNKDLSAIIKDVEFIHVLGFSFSVVDEDYLDWIYNHTTSSCKWEISWYSEKDKENINRFIDSQFLLRERTTLFRL
jgi:hypothetical protein